MSASEASRDGWGQAARGACGILADAPWVIGLRLLRLASGGRAAREELALMVAEKWFAHAACVEALAGERFGRSPGEIAAGTIAYYGQWVSDNRRRLSTGSQRSGAGKRVACKAENSD